MTTRRYLPEDRHNKAPKLPDGRPPTKREVWEHFHAIYFDFKGHKQTPLCLPGCTHRNPGELEAFCRDAWVWWYVYAYNFRDWRKQPNWTESDPIIPEGVPDQPFMSGEAGKWRQTLETLLETVNQLTERRAA